MRENKEGKMLRVLRYIVLGLPLYGLFGLTVWAYGWEEALIGWGIAMMVVGVTVGCAFMGMRLLDR